MVEENKNRKKQVISDDIYNKIKQTWQDLLRAEFEKDYYKKIIEFLNKEDYYPDSNSIFKFLTYFDVKDTNVIIIGQDPYHGKDQAMGLAFSVSENARIPPSLKNIYKEINRSLGIPLPAHGCLIKWAEQGVLLLNSSLTVSPGLPGSHYKLKWYKLTDEIIRIVSKHANNCVFILWGNSARKKQKLINEKKHLVLFSVHPSPLSASKGFIGNNHFVKCNEYLKQHQKKEIDWSI